MEKIRLQKYLSQSGICSRRKGEEYIEKGYVLVNGEIAKIGQSVDPDIDKITFKDRLIEDRQNYVYYKMNKPRGIVTTCAQGKEKNIIDIIDIKERVFPIGRLDKDTTGLILLTNDGRLANFLMHPKYEHEKEYVVKVYGPITDTQLDKMRKGIFILGSYTKKCRIDRISAGSFKIYLKEGKNRQIRRMVENVGAEVKWLKRVRICNIECGGLLEGEYKHLSQKEITNLKATLGID